jgi:hypothetical protein
MHTGQRYVVHYRDSEPTIRIVHYQSNTRFEAAKSSVLAALPPDAPTEAHEHALSDFYKKWVVQEQARQGEYDVELRKRTFEDVSLSAKVEFQRAKKKLAGWRFL